LHARDRFSEECQAVPSRDDHAHFHGIIDERELSSKHRTSAG
jgi:hypothetical protein